MVNPLALQNSAIDADSVASWISVPSVLTIGGLVNGTRSTASLFNNAAVTSLTLNPTLAGVTKTFTNVISGAPGMTLTKTGAGTQVLGGLNTYTGDTIVKEGTLSITQAYLADASTVRIGILPGDSAVLDLNHALTDTVAQLFIDGVPMPAGTHGSTASTATYKDATAFLGTGVLNVTSGPSGFASWVGGYGLTLGNAAAAFDHDLDGLDNAVEYVLGTNPAVANAGAFVFTFQRSLASKTPDTVVAIEVGTTLAAWPLVYQVDTAPEVTITPGPTGYETVTLTVTRAPDASKFARLRVTVTDP
jgi:autotransporter-associated beta strand protein